MNPSRSPPVLPDARTVSEEAEVEAEVSLRSPPEQAAPDEEAAAMDEARLEEGEGYARHAAQEAYFPAEGGQLE